MLINGFLAYLPNDRGMAGPRVEDSGFARVRRWAEEEGRPVYAPGEAGNGFVLSVRGQGANGLTHTFFDSDGGRLVGREEPAGRILLHVVPGAAASPAARETEALPPTVDAWEAWAERRVDIFNLIEAGPGHFRVLSDVLSLLPYWVGELADGVVVSSSIKDLLSVFPELARPHDPIGITHFLFGGKGTRTVHARIRASAPGTTLRWAEREGVTALRDRRLGPVPLDPDLGTGKAVQEAVDLLGDKIASFVEGSDDCVLTLTGGFDSRLMACVMKERGIPFRTATLGERFHTEVRVARRIARILDLPHEVLRPRGDLNDPIPLWLKVQGGQAGYGTAYTMELLDRGYEAGIPMLHGLLGGNLAYGGAYFSLPGIDNTPEGAGRFLVDWTLKDLVPDFGRVVGLPVGAEDLLQDMVPDVLQADSSLHTMLIWDLEHRQPRGVGAQLTYLGEEYRVGAPFYDRRQIASWMSIPRMGHEDRRVLRWIFQEKYPEVATIPHAEEDPYLLPNTMTAARHVAARLAFRVRDGVLRRLLPGRWDPADRRYIWKVWHGQTPEQVKRQMESIEEKSGLIEEVLGWTPPPLSSEPFWDRVATTPMKAEKVRTSFYLLGEYCSWLST